MTGDYQEKLDREKEWYHDHKHEHQHLLNSSFFFSIKRNNFNYVFPKRVMADVINVILKNQDSPNILIAPVGRGEDIAYLRGPKRALTGIDVSVEALAEISDHDVAKVEGDMAHMTAFEDGNFDVVVVSLFFHHYVKQGFDPFFKEILRVLKPGGHVVILEPSVLYPLSWITRAARKIWGNITGQVEDEEPISPFSLLRSMRHNGFYRATKVGAGFCHNRTPIFIAKCINPLLKPLLHVPILNSFCWMCVFHGQKEKP